MAMKARMMKTRRGVRIAPYFDSGATGMSQPSRSSLCPGLMHVRYNATELQVPDEISAQEIFQ